MNEITVFEQLEQDIVKFEEVNAELNFDIETYEGETECKKYLGKLRKVWNRIEKLRKSTKAEFIAKGKEVDVEAKTFLERIDAMHNVHNAPMQALETKRVNEMLAEQEADRVEAARIQDENDAELEKLRKIVADQEAAAKATEDAAKIEADKLEAVEAEKRKAETDAINAKVLADKAKDDAVAAEKKRVADLYAKEQAAIEKTAQAIRVRQADKEHRKDFNNKAVLAIDATTANTAMSTDIVKAIVRGEIPNVTLNY